MSYISFINHIYDFYGKLMINADLPVFYRLNRSKML